MAGNTMGEIGERILDLLTYKPMEPLIFSSGLFLFLFLGFCLFYPMMRRAVLMRTIYITLFSLFFYYKTSGIYVLLLMAVAMSDFLVGRAIGRATTQRSKKWFLALGITIDLGILGYFKYTNFLIDIFRSVTNSNFLDFQTIFLPVGISFFLFQSISYTIDIYRGRIEALKSPLDYLFYLSFFPQLVAGPIVRARDFLPQIKQNPLIVTREMFGRGIFLIAIGLFKKAIISDYISLNFVDRVFDDPLLYSGFENLMGIYGYALQIYCDFSGYSDMAIGIALLLGFHFNTNFDSPYKSATITEFWRRWHISLSSWLKDYLYISLGGNRKGRLRTYLNLIITMLLGGLWHGAAWRFVIWGAWHGVALACHKWLLETFPRLKQTGGEMKPWGRILGIFLTFHLVCASWILFRADSLETGWHMLTQIGSSFHVELIGEVIAGYQAIFLLIAVGYLLHMMPKRSELWAERTVINAPLVLKVVLLAIIIWGVMLIKSSDIQPFIYFQF